jgi:hypothetical protein
MDIAAKPVMVSNPPKFDEIEKPGIYIYGTLQAMEALGYE